MASVFRFQFKIYYKNINKNVVNTDIRILAIQINVMKF